MQFIDAEESKWMQNIADAVHKKKNANFKYTSSTAQGGGGSFKNRNPKRRVGCCDSRMAERTHWWTERCLRSPLFLSLSLSFSLFLSLSLSLSLFLSLSLTIYLPTYLSIYVSIYVSIYLCIYRSIDRTIYLSMYQCIYVSIYLF